MVAHRILIVDDSLVAGLFLQRLLDEDGRYQVVSHARNGAEALQQYRQHSPELVILDLVMPVMDGLSALRALMATAPDAKVLVVSSVGGVSNLADEALRLGAVGVIQKPFEWEEVSSRLEAVFGLEAGR